MFCEQISCWNRMEGSVIDLNTYGNFVLIKVLFQISGKNMYYLVNGVEIFEEIFKEKMLDFDIIFFIKINFVWINS